MAMTADEVLKLHVGNLVVQIAMLQAEVERLRVELAVKESPVKLTTPETN